MNLLALVLTSPETHGLEIPLSDQMSVSSIVSMNNIFIMVIKVSKYFQWFMKAVTLVTFICYIMRVWRYQRGNQNPYIEEEQTTQWPKEKGQKDKQRSTKHTHKTKDRVTRSPLKIEGELRWSGRVGSSCSTSDTRRVNLLTNLVISYDI